MVGTTLLEVGIVAAAGVVLAAVVWNSLKRRGANQFPAAVGGVCIGVIVGLSLGDVVVDGAGDTWATHPMLAAAIVGVAFLGLTVLVIEHAVERANTRRWRDASSQRVAELIATRDDPLVRRFQTCLEPLAPRAKTATTGELIASGAAARDAAMRLDDDVANAPAILVLLAINVNLHGIFDAVRAYVAAAGRLAETCNEFGARVDDAKAQLNNEQLWRSARFSLGRLLGQWAEFETSSKNLSDATRERP